MVGVVGLKAPRVVIKPLSQPTDIVPVVFTPPEEQPKTQPEEKQEPDETQPDTQTETPQVVTTVAVMDSPAVAFAVPVPGAVAIAPMAHMATPPPPVTHQQPAPKPVQFNPSAAGNEGVFPPPEYPIAAQRNHYQGTVLIEIKVAPDGTITSASVYKTSGFVMLDDAALQVVKKRWRFAPGKERWLHWPCQFVMQ